MRFIFTKEPGTWVMFVIAYAAGMAKAGAPDLRTLMVFSSLSLFLMAKTPFSSYLRNRDNSLLALVIALSAGGALTGIYPVITNPGLALLYAFAGVLITLFFVFLRRGMPMLSEACGMAIMGETACMAASVNSSILPNLYIWIFFFVFYFASSLRVRFTMRGYRLWSGLYSAAAVLAGIVMALKGSIIFLSFMPLIEDIYAAITGKRDDFKRLGIIETVKSIIFALILIYI